MRYLQQLRRGRLHLHRTIALSCFVLLSFSSCASDGSAPGITDRRLAEGYIPLYAGGFFVSRWAAAVAVAPHIAVTNAHNGELLADDRILARSDDYDLLFFLTEHTAAPQTASPVVGQTIVAYGQGRGDRIIEARGTIGSTIEWVPPRCAQCPVQHAFMYEAAAGPGFSGGPVMNVAGGEIIGITFGYRDNREGEHWVRQMYAYDMDVVRAEMRRLLGNNATVEATYESQHADTTAP